MSDNPVFKYFSEFKILKTFSKDFWLSNAVQFFECLAYFSMINVLALYLTQNYGFSDLDSNIWVGVYTLFVTAFMFAIGSICDIIGIKKALYIGLALHIVSRLGLALGSNISGDFSFPFFDSSIPLSSLTVQSSILVMALGSSFVTPVIQVCIRRFSLKKARGTGFNMYYLIMNIAALIATFLIIDLSRKWYGSINGQEWIMNIGVATTLIAFLIACFIDPNNLAEKDEAQEGPQDRRPLAILSEVWKERAFQKLVLFLFLSIGVRLVFTLQILIFPKYYTRILYEDFPIGFANGINPIIIVSGLILVIPILNKYSTIKLIVTGLSISAFSMILLIFPVHWFLALPFINTLSDAFMFVVFTQIIFFALGELFFSPRFTEYVASVAPKDKVTSYMALSALPMYIAKPINGVLSGILVSHFCYEGIRAKIDAGSISYLESPQAMWIIYAVLAILSPLSVILLRNKLSNHKSDSHPDNKPDVVPITKRVEHCEQEIKAESL